MSAFAAWCLIWPAGECLCQTITIKCAVVRADQDIRGGKGITGTGLIAHPVSNKEHGQWWGQALEPWNWLRLYLRKTDLNWTLLRWKMLILCIFPPNIESWRLGSPETYNLASTDFLNTWEERGKRLRRYQRIRNGLLQTCRQFNDNVVLVQSPIKSAQWYPSDQKWFESISQCRKWIGKILLQKKAPDERFTDCSSVIHLSFLLAYSCI